MTQRIAITKQEFKHGVNYRVRTLAEYNREVLHTSPGDHPERVTRWIDTDMTKQQITDALKLNLEDKVQDF